VSAVAELLRLTSEPDTLARLGDGLAITGRVALEEDPRWDAPTLAREANLLTKDGWLELEGATDDASALREAIDRLAGEKLPPLFVYAYDETWRIAARLARGLGEALGVAYDLVADAWAFRVAPGPDNAGWAPHRGSYELAANRRAPDLVNAWVALTDATPDNACMYVVPLDDDPAYPGDLQRHEVPIGVARAVPAKTGTALVWNANVLHWGGRSSRRAREPRVNVTFTFRRRGASGAHPLIDLDAFDLRKRLDVIADQVLVYGNLDRTLSPEIREWAKLTRGFTDAIAARKEG
jgi:hypothetical protein